MESLLQEELEKEGLGKVKIVRLENTEKGILKVIGYDEQGGRYQVLPSPKNTNVAVMAWPGKEGTEEMQKREGVMNFNNLAGREQNKEGVLVGPAVKYASEAVIDETGAALWTKVV